MATMKDVPPEYDNIKSLDDQRKRPGPGVELMDNAGNVTMIDDPADIPPLPDNVVPPTVGVDRTAVRDTIATAVIYSRTCDSATVLQARKLIDLITNAIMNDERLIADAIEAGCKSFHSGDIDPIP